MPAAPGVPRRSPIQVLTGAFNVVWPLRATDTDLKCNIHIDGVEAPTRLRSSKHRLTTIRLEMISSDLVDSIENASFLCLDLDGFTE